MDLEKIKALIALFEQSSLSELSVQEGDFSARLQRAVGGSVLLPHVPAALVSEPQEDCFISAPIIGSFYTASAPDMPPFVKLGDVVRAGQTVCILEAMKLMNEIESEYDCEIVEILVSNEQKVGYGQPLFRVRRV